MRNLKFINSGAWLLAAVLLFIPFFSLPQTVFAGVTPSQGGVDMCSPNPIDPEIIGRCCSVVNPPSYCPAFSRQEKKMAAAMNKYQRDETTGAGTLSGGGDSDWRGNFSFFAAVLILFGGIWALFALSLNRFGKRIAPHRSKLSPIYKFAFQPSTALTVFGLLLAAAIVGGGLIAPEKTSAGKRKKPDKSKMTGLMNPSSKPVFKSAQVVGGSGITQIGVPVFDQSGNRYVSGGFTGTITFGATNLTATRDFDAFIAKYDAAGNALWARRGSGMTTGVTNIPIEGATALAVDADGNVYVGGSFVKTLTLQGGANPNVTLGDDGAAGFNYEAFVAKYDANGNILWARGGNSGSPKNSGDLEIGQNIITRIIFDTNGNPFVAGFVSGTNFLGAAITNNGLTDGILAKLDQTNGAVISQQMIGGTDDDTAIDLKIDGANNLYLIGTFASPSITFPNGGVYENPDDPNDTLPNSTNTYIAKFDQKGENSWVGVIDNADLVSISQIAVSGAGEIYLTGSFIDSVTFPTKPETTLIETEGSGDEEESSEGGYIAKMDTDGNFIWAKQFGGVGEGIALDAAGRVSIIGTFYDGGTFGEKTPNEEVLASFGGQDLFVARYDANGGFDWAKPISGSSREGEALINSPNGETKNNYNPLGIAFNPASGTTFISGDFRGAIALDCITLDSSTDSRAYLAEISADNEATSCRIWNGLDEDDNNFDSPDNWNGGVIPTNYDSIYVPYTGNSFDNPTYNPNGIGIIVNNLTVSDDRTLTVERSLPIVGKLWLLGGFIDTGEENLLDLTDTATANRVADLDGDGGYVIGKIRKEFGDTNPFIFPVGTSNGYSPVDVNPQEGIGASLAIKAFEQPQPLFANTPNRINRYWSIDRAGKGFLVANLKFHYLESDVVGDESLLNLFKVEYDEPMQQPATIDTTANTATVNNVFEFSDWTLAQAAPTAANVSVGGRVTTANGQGISQVRVSLTDQNGVSRSAATNAFGYFTFDDVASGQTFVVEARHRRYRFAAQVVTVSEAVENLDFTPQ